MLNGNGTAPNLRFNPSQVGYKPETSFDELLQEVLVSIPHR